MQPHLIKFVFTDCAKAELKGPHLDTVIKASSSVPQITNIVCLKEAPDVQFVVKAVIFDYADAEIALKILLDCKKDT